MKTWELETREPYFSHIKNGLKRYEARVPDITKPHKRYNEISEGDSIKIILVN